MHLHAYFILKLLLASVLCKKKDEQIKNPTKKQHKKNKTNKQANNQTNKTEKRKQQQITKCPS